jgi:hypothetical protein
MKQQQPRILHCLYNGIYLRRHDMHDHIINIRYTISLLFWRVREANASRGT